MNNIFKLKIPAAIAAALALFTAMLLLAPVGAKAANHDLALSAEVLPNGQYGYKRGDSPADNARSWFAAFAPTGASNSTAVNSANAVAACILSLKILFICIILLMYLAVH